MVDKLPPGAMQPITSNWCHSVVELKKVDFEWTIHEYELRGPGQRLESKEFPIIEGSRNFYMPYHCLILEDKAISIDSYNYNYGGPILRVKTAFLNAKREKVFLNEFIIRAKKTGTFHVNSTPREILLQKSNDLIVNGCLTIYCEVEYYDDNQNKELFGKTTIQSHSPSLNHQGELMKDFGDLFEDARHSDVTINVAGQQFRAHKVLLAARSPVFAAMFEHPVKENMTGIVNISDIEVDVFQELLHYIYTGQVTSKRMDEVAAGLFAAADKYLLTNLKKACGDHLIKQISPENCIKLLSLGENDPAYYLRKNAVDYCRKFPAEVMATASWKKAIVEIAPWMGDVLN